MPNHPLTLLAVLMLLPVLVGCGAGGLLDPDLDKPADTPPGESMTSGERALALQVLDIVNQERLSAGLEILAWDERAADAAYDHCVDMRLRDYVAHTNPDGLDPCRRLTEAGVELLACGENLARGHASAAAVMTAWMASPGHAAALLNPGYTRIGIGVHTGRGGPWWTQDFIAPALDR